MTTEGRVTGSDPDLRPSPDALRRGLLRFVVALAVSMALAAALWWQRPDSLTPPINVVGFPSFADFNYLPILWAWRIVVWQIPLVLIAVYVALWRWGPWAEAVPVAAGRRASLAPDPPGPADAASSPTTYGVWVAALAVPGFLVWYAASLAGAAPGSGFTRAGFLVGALYVVLVVLVTWAVRAGLARRRASEPPSSTEVLTGLSALMGAVLAPAVAAWASGHSVALEIDGSESHWPWLPWWVAGAAALGVLGWVVWSLHRGADPVGCERRVRMLWLGPTLVALLTMALPPALGLLEGFDDSQSVLGADLLTRGYFPWRDFVFIHGLFEDGLRSWVGWQVFEPTIWGALGSYSMIFAPLFWVLLYLMACYVAPRSHAAPVAVVVLAASFYLPVSTRWVLVAAVYVLLAETLRRRSARAWVVALTALLFVDAVLVPEAFLQVIACAVVLVLSDLATRPQGVRWWRSLRGTVTFVTTGAVLSLVWLGFLATRGAMLDFIGYYLYFGPGHNESGTLPVTGTPLSYWMWMAGLACAVWTTLVFVAWRWLHVGPLTPLHWTTLAAALAAGAYGEKAWGRFDFGHVFQNIMVALPLYLLLGAGIIGAVDRWLRRRMGGSRRLAPVARSGLQPVALAAVGLLVFVLGLSGLLHAPGRLLMTVPGPTTIPRVGYMEPGALDETLLDDLQAVMDTYAGPDGPVFDFTNSPGYIYYLLHRTPATPFVHISMAAVERAQRVVVEDLERSQPPVVVYDTTAFGIPAWDGPRAGVRHFMVGQYLLDHWTPVIAVRGTLFLIRNDLVAQAPPPPALSQAPVTEDLYFSQPACEWGYSAAYLESEPEGPEVALDVDYRPGYTIQIVGWSYDVERDTAVDDVLVVSDDRVVGSVPPDGPRPDVAADLGLTGAEQSGFGGSLTFEAPRGSPIYAYALLEDGTAAVITPPPGFVPPAFIEDGQRRIPVVAEARNVGVLAALEGTPIVIGAVDVPPSVDLREFSLASFEADGPIGLSSLRLTDSLGLTNAPGVNRVITFSTLESTQAISVRVGSCLQWHGFRGRHLYLTQDEGPPVRRVVLSHVRDD